MTLTSYGNRNGWFFSVLVRSDGLATPVRVVLPRVLPGQGQSGSSADGSIHTLILHGFASTK